MILGIFLGTYLIGCVLGYILLKKCVIKELGSWTKGDRANMLTLAITSWAAVMTVGIIMLGEIFESDEPAKW